MFASLGLPELLRAAQHEDEVFLPRMGPGWQGAAPAVADACDWTRANSSPKACRVSRFSWVRPRDTPCLA
jgi:hypothetical protein